MAKFTPPGVDALMTTPLKAREISDYANKHPGLPDRAYLLDVLGDRIGLLYVTPEAYTLAWPGSVDFDKLEQEAGLAFGAALRLEPIDLSKDEQRKKVTASFIVAGADAVELHQYALGRTDQFSDYTDVVQTPAEIAFARYDFADSPQAEPFFSFIAENDVVSSRDDNEVAVKLLRSTRCSTELLDWVVGHHHDAPGLRSRIDLARSAAIVNMQMTYPA